MWSSGDQVIYREVTHGKVWTVRPVTVIQDSSDLIALYLRNGTHWKVCTPVDSKINLLHCKANFHPWTLQDVVWTYGDTVFLIFPRNAYAIHVMWDQRHSFVGWYVNLQECLRRTPLGFDFLDQELDIEVSPNLDWRWKDIHHLEEAQHIGLLSLEQSKKILQEGQKVVENIEEKAVPFDGSWNNWHPPTGWSIPYLPDTWEQVY